MLEQDTIKRDNRLAEHNNLMVAFLNFHSINLKGFKDWRWLGGIEGEVQGLSKFRGSAMMTDGIECLLLNGANEVNRVHYTFFVPDVITPEFNPQKQTKTKKKVIDILAALCAQ